MAFRKRRTLRVGFRHLRKSHESVCNFTNRLEKSSIVEKYTRPDALDVNRAAKWKSYCVDLRELNITAPLTFSAFPRRFRGLASDTSSPSLPAA